MSLILQSSVSDVGIGRYVVKSLINNNGTISRLQFWITSLSTLFLSGAVFLIYYIVSPALIKYFDFSWLVLFGVVSVTWLLSMWTSLLRGFRDYKTIPKLNIVSKITGFLVLGILSWKYSNIEMKWFFYSILSIELVKYLFGSFLFLKKVTFVSRVDNFDLKFLIVSVVRRIPSLFTSQLDKLLVFSLVSGGFLVDYQGVVRVAKLGQSLVTRFKSIVLPEIAVTVLNDDESRLLAFSQRFNLLSIGSVSALILFGPVLLWFLGGEHLLSYRFWLYAYAMLFLINSSNNVQLDYLDANGIGYSVNTLFTYITLVLAYTIGILTVKVGVDNILIIMFPLAYAINLGWWYFYFNRVSIITYRRFLDKRRFYILFFLFLYVVLDYLFIHNL